MTINTCFECVDCGVKRSLKGIVQDHEENGEFVCHTCYMEQQTFTYSSDKHIEQLFGKGFPVPYTILIPSNLAAKNLKDSVWSKSELNYYIRRLKSFMVGGMP